jgi:hypothetical protein
MNKAASVARIEDCSFEPANSRQSLISVTGGGTMGDDRSLLTTVLVISAVSTVLVLWAVLSF